ncbi:MAG: fatty acid desaturase, partial [Myxococcales bacterium]|nr:fatty acid desaturase [Myxococcales bacterium]
MLVDPNRYFDKDQLTALRRISPLRGLGSVLWTWAWIVACFAAYAIYPSVWTVLGAWLVMSGRHLALAILMHEASHGLIVRSKRANDWVGQWLTAYPAMTDMLLYRATHFVHHRETWTQKDPDLSLAAALPVSRRSFRRKMVRDLTGQTAYKRHRVLARYAAGLSVSGKGLEGKSPWRVLGAFVRNQRGFLITNGLMLGGLTAVGIPEAYLLVWWLPWVTGYSVV